MNIELYKSDVSFLGSILHKTYLKSLVNKIDKSQAHPEFDEMVICKLSINETKDLIGQLCFEANHSRSKTFIEHADYIIESLEYQVQLLSNAR